ncbi:MAG: DAK2 domain-containing protein [Chloroflexota bacterium]|nr:DAK2 domain-containing protein [Chloroflexota bacterium]
MTRSTVPPAGSNVKQSERTVWNGEALLAAFALATAWLNAHRDQVNALNVFPVPDGDTGTNMSLTMRAAIDAGHGDDVGQGASAVAKRIAYGALMGARGNSGVILSQIFRGFANAITDVDEIDGRDLAYALSSAREMAYKAVMKPVEGTMLTVIRGAAERAEVVASRTPALTAVLAAAVQGASDALATTPDLLDILRQAGVVDAGGQGVVYIIEGLEKYARGETELPAVAADAAKTPLGSEMVFLDHIEELHEDDAFGYCTNFMVFGDGIEVEKCRDEIAAMGRSAVIVGDSTMLKVHIHAENPGEVLAYALRLGALDQIKIDNMQQQTRTLTAQRGQEREHPRQPAPPDTSGQGAGPAVLAVAAGNGIGAALRSLGATGLIHGGQTMNPSTEELLRAVEDCGADEVILLPNNKNILMAAHQVPELTDKRVQIVPTRSVPQALAALTVVNSESDLDSNAQAMTAATEGVRTVEITRAIRDVELGGIRVAHGQVIGLIDDELAVAGDDELAVAGETLRRADAAEAELVTIFPGEGVTDAEVEELAATARDLSPDAEVEIHAGGQPHYRYIIAVE